MIIAEYLNRIWIQESIESLNIGFNYLVSKGIPYIEATEYFLKNYGIAITCATYRSTDDAGVKLQLNLKDREIDARTLYAISSTAVFGSESSWDEETGCEYTYSYILLDMDQTIEQL